MSGYASAVETAEGDHVKISWVAPKSFGISPETIGLRFQIDPDWHIYWKNPGDSGAAPKFVLSGDSAGPLLWPRPHRIQVAHLTNIGYEDEVVFTFEVTPAAKAAKVQLKAQLEWLVCKVECIPGFATLEMMRPIQGAQAEWLALNLKKRDAFLNQVPSSDPQQIESLKKAWLVSRAENGLRIEVRDAESNEQDALQFYPTDPEILKPAAPIFERTDQGYSLLFATRPGQTVPTQVGFVVAKADQSWEIADLVVANGPAEVADPPLEVSLWLLLLSALLGGVILNLMPCVLPVLSIKFFSLAKASASHRRQEGLLYAAGVLATFTILGGVFLLLRAGGASVGWGYQLQSPPTILALILLFWLMGLNFFGFFEFGTSLMSAAGRFKNAGSFATGMLSVFVAAPCTGPFMGAALGAAATLPTLPSILIFVFLGLGLSLPFLLLSFFPSLLKGMPKPGAWMERFKQFLAFPLFGTVIWLLWVLGVQVGTNGWFYASVLLFVVAFAIWLGRGRRLSQVLGWLLVIAALIFSYQGLQRAAMRATRPSDQAVSANWQNYDPQLLRSAQANRQAVFVDFTAAWCITCQVNKKVVLETSAAAQIFERNKVLLMRGDWTKQDPVITEALAAFGRNSVPFYVFYPASGATPVVLPQILTVAMIEDLFSTQAKGGPK